MTHENPRILIVGAYTFLGDDATTITLRNLFSCWKTDEIAFVHITDKEFSKDNNPTKIVNKRIFFNYSAKDNSSALTKKIRESRSLIDGVSGIVKGGNYRTFLFNFIHTIISAYRSIIPYEYTNELELFITDFKPDLLYSPLGSISIIKLVNKISKRHNLPLIPHFMDDWKNIMYRGSLFLLIPRILLNMNLKRIINKMPFGLVISKYMADEYSAYFNKPFYSFMNCVSYSDDNNTLLNEKDDNQFAFCYAGGLHLRRSNLLLEICKALQSLDIKFVLNIYTSNKDWHTYGNDFKEYNCAKYKGFVDENTLHKVLITQDCLVHIESFDKQIVPYTRLSISTKISDYLSAGKPILAIGPRNIASIKYLEECNVGLIISEIQDDFNEQILWFISDKETLMQFSLNASLESKKHDMNVQTQELRKLFNSII